MVTLGEFVLSIVFAWLVLILLANRFDLQKYHLMVSSGFLFFVPDIFNRMLQNLAEKELFWTKFARYALLIVLTLFCALPILLTINLVKGVFFSIAPLFYSDVLDVLRVENFLLIIPLLAIFLSIQMLISGVHHLIEGHEIEQSGILVAGIIPTFFSKFQQQLSRSMKVRSLSITVVCILIITLLAFPLSAGMSVVYSNAYGESQGALVTVIYPNSPAMDSNIDVGQVITELRVPQSEFDISRITIDSAISLQRNLEQIPAGTSITYLLYDPGENSTQIYTIIGVQPPEDVTQDRGSYLGIASIDYQPSEGLLPIMLPFWTSLFFDWMINIGLLFSLFSLLPLPFLPGYTLLEEINEIMNLGLSDRGLKVVSYMVVLLFGLNILYYAS